MSDRTAHLTNQGPVSRPSKSASIYSEIADLMLALTKFNSPSQSKKSPHPKPTQRIPKVLGKIPRSVSIGQEAAVFG